MATANDVQAKKEIYAPYNILPLDSAGTSQSIMQLDEVTHLPWSSVHWTVIFLLDMLSGKDNRTVSLTSCQVKAAVSALWNTRGLSWPASFEQQRQKTGDLDLLDWLRAMFGFQVWRVIWRIRYLFHNHQVFAKGFTGYGFDIYRGIMSGTRGSI